MFHWATRRNDWVRGRADGFRITSGVCRRERISSPHSAKKPDRFSSSIVENDASLDTRWRWLLTNHNLRAGRRRQKRFYIARSPSAREHRSCEQDSRRSKSFRGRQRSAAELMAYGECRFICIGPLRPGRFAEQDLVVESTTLCRSRRALSTVKAMPTAATRWAGNGEDL